MRRRAYLVSPRYLYVHATFVRAREGEEQTASYFFSWPSAAPGGACPSFSCYSADVCCCWSAGGPCGGGAPFAPFKLTAPAFGSGMGRFAFGLRAISCAWVA